MNFQLHPQLVSDCALVTELALCTLLLMNERRYPWFILVPRVAGMTELYQLEQDRREQFLAESCWLAERLNSIYRPDKLNIASIGNQVAQLHVHHIVRYRSDPVWPGTVWCDPSREVFSRQQLADKAAELRQALAL